MLRESKETVHLLEDAARRHMQTEASCNGTDPACPLPIRFSWLISCLIIAGLVILEASYGPSERDEATAGLDVDVTVPLQALVHRSQLYIPGRRSKVSRIPIPRFAKIGDRRPSLIAREARSVFTPVSPSPTAARLSDMRVSPASPYSHDLTGGLTSYFIAFSRRLGRYAVLRHARKGPHRVTVHPICCLHLPKRRAPPRCLCSLGMDGARCSKFASIVEVKTATA